MTDNSNTETPRHVYNDGCWGCGQREGHPEWCPNRNAS